MSSVPAPGDGGALRISDLPLDEVVGRLLDRLIHKKDEGLLRDDLDDLGSALSPHELAEIYKYIKGMTTEKGQVRIALHAPMWTQLTVGTGAVFSREVLFEGTTLYRSAVQGALRPVLVCFTSRHGGMFLRNCRFLDMLGHHPIDVVINSTESGTFGHWHLGRTASFAGSLFTLKAALAERGITPRLYAGASAGCGPAVYAATLDRPTAAALFSCRFYMPGRSIRLADAGPAFEPICDCWQGRLPQVYNIYGALQPIDRKDDRRLRALVPGTQSVPLAGDDTHSPMVTLTARRKLRAVLELLVQAAGGAQVNFKKVINP